MKNSKSKKIAKIIFVILTVITLAVIWGHSMVPPEGSTEESMFFKGIFDGMLHNVSGNSSFSIPEVLIRKSAHFSEYALLGAEFCILYLLFFSKPEHIRLFPLYLNTILASLLVAMTDETIQYFSGRYSSVFDVWLDCMGAAVAIPLVYLLVRRFFISDKKK